MRIVVRAVGKASASTEGELAEKYRERAAQFGRKLGISRVEIAEIAESKARSAGERKTAEANALCAGLATGQVRVALDGRGQNLSSEAFAERLNGWRETGRDNVVFLIGGADGLAQTVVDEAHMIMALGAATWPHLLVRTMLCEQIYRAFTILAGHPYHRA